MSRYFVSVLPRCHPTLARIAVDTTTAVVENLASSEICSKGVWFLLQDFIECLHQYEYSIVHESCLGLEQEKIHSFIKLLISFKRCKVNSYNYIYIYIYIGSTQPRAVHPLPNAKDVYSPPYPLPCLCSSWSPSPDSSMIVAVFLFFSYRALSTGKSSLANDYLPF